jgi:hypothetical protein
MGEREGGEGKGDGREGRKKEGMGEREKGGGGKERGRGGWEGGKMKKSTCAMYHISVPLMVGPRIPIAPISFIIERSNSKGKKITIPFF